MQDNYPDTDRCDHVHCNYCERESLVPQFTDICIKCGKDGFLKWVDENNPEREPEDFANSKELLQGDYWKQAQENAMNG